jgi:aminoglycoside/choline kinase family phosphotransferase/GTP:adenosylcobinamide-phosphate guanylyltransferase
MKAIILAAGLGTRLLPHTQQVPKPLFSLGGKPVLEILIESLIRAGCHSLMINTHHLGEKIEAFLSQKHFAIPVEFCREPDILGTGGAIKNVENFWDDTPFMVVNSDIVTDIDFRKVYDFHLDHPFPVTLVLTDSAGLNSVSCDSQDFITDFYIPKQTNGHHSKKKLYTFTGIQVVNKEVLDLIPKGTFYSVIDAYIDLMKSNRKIKAFFAGNSYWKDIGTPERYREAVLDRMIPEAFLKAFPEFSESPPIMTRLKGDGSDRGWFRLRSGNNTLIFADHGIHTGKEPGEADAFISIGLHLHSRGVPVPRIVHEDTFSGIVFMQDLGDIDLQKTVLKEKDPNVIKRLYENVINRLCHMGLQGALGFEPSWTFQTTHYDRHLILERECRYFVDAFLRNYLNLNIGFEDLAPDFYHLADQIREFSYEGFMHRDFQSRNIMVNGNDFFFIDFQGGRLGPIQYDLASLLIDPYTALSPTLQGQLLKFCIDNLGAKIPLSPDRFQKGFHYCAISRNLQILGAFGFLTRIKKKVWFEKYIPQAMNTLKNNLNIYFKDHEFKLLRATVKNW